MQETPNSTSTLGWIKDFNALWGYEHNNPPWPNQAKVTRTLCILIFTASTVSVICCIALLSILHPLRAGQLVDFESLHFRLVYFGAYGSFLLTICLALLVWTVASGVPKDDYPNMPGTGSTSHLYMLLTLHMSVYIMMLVFGFIILRGICEIIAEYY